jgi:tRNA-dihydrouridine synthase 1
MAVEETTSTSETNGELPKKTKLHGRAFYESLGSPKMILAPMVDQSEYVGLL